MTTAELEQHSPIPIPVREDERMNTDPMNDPRYRDAYEAGFYTDRNGTEWTRTMDGWVDRSDAERIILTRHMDMARIIIDEAAE